MSVIAWSSITPLAAQVPEFTKSSLGFRKGSKTCANRWKRAAFAGRRNASGIRWIGDNNETGFCFLSAYFYLTFFFYFCCNLVHVLLMVLINSFRQVVEPESKFGEERNMEGLVNFLWKRNAIPRGPERFHRLRRHFSLKSRRDIAIARAVFLSLMKIIYEVFVCATHNHST